MSLPQTPSPDKPRRAAVYVRVSSAGQAEDGTSLQSQEERCRAYCAEHGYQVVQFFREVFTGTELWERPQLTALRDAVRHRAVDVVVAYAIDRLSRDPVHLGVVLSEADHAGVAVEFVSEPLDASPEGQLIRYVRGYAAKIEHAKLRERSTTGHRTRVANGKPLLGPKSPYGLRWDEEAGRYLPVEAEAEVLCRLKAEVLAGRTLRGISAGLAADGIPSPTGRPRWSESTIRYLLTAEIYTGAPRAYSNHVVRQDGEWRRAPTPEGFAVPLPEGIAPVLITADEQEAIRAILERNRALSVRNSQDPEAFLLRAGFIRCGLCGGAMVGISKADGRRVYACTTHAKRRDRCPGTSISARQIDAEVWARIVAIVEDPETIRREIEARRGDDPTAGDLAAVRRRLADVDRQQANLTRHLALFSDPEAAAPVVRHIEELRHQADRLRQEEQTVLSRQREWAEAERRLEGISEWCRRVRTRLPSLAYAEKRDLVLALQVDVRVYPTGHPDRWEIDLDVSPEEPDVRLCSTSRSAADGRRRLRPPLSRPAPSGTVSAIEGVMARRLPWLVAPGLAAG